MINLVVTGSPFGDERLWHMGARGGDTRWGAGHVDDADVTLTTDYETAREVFLSGNPQAGMQAFMAGKIKVQGDMTKLMEMQSAPPDASQQEVAKKIQEITE